MKISKALRMQCKELGRSCSQPLEGFLLPKIAQEEFLDPPIQAPEFRDPSYPKGILTHIIGVLRLPPNIPQHPRESLEVPTPWW